MSIRRALAPIAPVTAAFAGYFGSSPALGRYSRNPPELWAGAAVSAAMGVRNVRRPGPLGRIAGVVGVASPGLVWWYLHRYSPYDPPSDDLAIGEPFPDFDLPAIDGGQLTAGDLRGDRVLLMCYRGGW